MIRSFGTSLFRSVRLCFLVALFFLAGIAVQAYAEGIPDQDLSTVIQKVEERYKSLADLQAHFIQLARILSFPQDQRSEGTVYLKRDRMMRWDYETPSKDQYFIRGDTVIYYAPDVKQARRINLSGREGIRSPLVFFEGLKSAEADYTIAFNKDPNFDRSSRHILELKPRDQKKIPLLKILLFISKTNFQVERVDQYDLYKNVTELYFRDVKTNQGLQDSLFLFQPPEGVEVIEQP
ncbi:MAG: outer membrane lipoprotein carrier protein LolA [bacterium]